LEKLVLETAIRKEGKKLRRLEDQVRKKWEHAYN
jgi:hypothetical protein